MEAKQIARALTDMSTTGEFFLEGEMKDGRIVIEKYGEDTVDILTVQEAIRYARVFALSSAVKCNDALEFLREHKYLGHPEMQRTARIINDFLERGLEITRSI